MLVGWWRFVLVGFDACGTRDGEVIWPWEKEEEEEEEEEDACDGDVIWLWEEEEEE